MYLTYYTHTIYTNNNVHIVLYEYTHITLKFNNQFSDTNKSHTQNTKHANTLNFMQVINCTDVIVNKYSHYSHMSLTLL